MSIQLNTTQKNAYDNISKFLDSDNHNKFLLLGPAGSGKTTVIVNIFDHCIKLGKEYRIAFAAFTNKATQVLRNISNKHKLEFNAEFLTIHKLLCLEPRYNQNNQLYFSYKKSNFSNYDIIIFDECSIISSDLYTYIQRAWTEVYEKEDRMIKLIFLGDFWQLPPVKEETSSIFTSAKEHKWPVSRLNTVMRFKNPELQDLNIKLLSIFDRFKKDDIDHIVKDFPSNIVDKKSSHYITNIYRQYIETLSITQDVVILTYSNADRDRLNENIQKILDKMKGRSYRRPGYFYKGDRCCVDNPVDIYKPALIDSKSRINDEDPKKYKLSSIYTGTLYNGDIFEVLYSEEILIKTALNTADYFDSYFDAQLLHIKPINDDTVYSIINIPFDIAYDINKLIRKNEYSKKANDIISEFKKKYPVLSQGYCITIYKSQGSEWNSVIVNLANVKKCLAKSDDMNFIDKLNIFKTTYTALTRASNKAYVVY
jgi:ATP-dependent exoDNAse (exonuclease V) alpha subunit